MQRPWNLLFGILTAQLHATRVDRLAGIIRECVDNPAIDLPSRLVAAGVLSEAEAQQAASLTYLAVQAHEHDAAAALAAFGGEGRAQRLLGLVPSLGPDRDGGVVKVLHGVRMQELLDRAPSLDERLALLPQFMELCRIVANAHDRGVVHRGLCPRGILVGDYGEIAVVDWSFSKMRGRQDEQGRFIDETVQTLRSDADLTAKTAEIAAALPYLAPEIALGHHDTVDARSDVYTLGAILYHLLTGRPPFAGARFSEVIVAVVSKKPDPVTAVEPAAPPALAAVCERALHQEPSARYACARQFADELRRAQNASPVPDRSHEPTRIASQQWTLLALAAAGVLCLLAVGAFSQRHAVRERDAAVVARGVEEQKRIAAEEGRNQLVQDLEEARQARLQAETERDQADAVLAGAQDAIKEAQATKLKAETALAKAASEPDEHVATEPGVQTGRAPTAEVIEPIKAAPKAPVPPNRDLLGPPDETGSRPPGLTRAELIKALSHLAAGLSMESGPDGRPQVTVHATDDEANVELQRLGFRNGDVITNVNRIAVDNTEQTKRALEDVKTDPGFTVRMVREGQSSWMRINVLEAMPAAPAKPPAETPAVPEEKAAHKVPAAPRERQSAEPPAASPAKESAEPDEKGESAESASPTDEPTQSSSADESPSTDGAPSAPEPAEP